MSAGRGTCWGVLDYVGVGNVVVHGVVDVVVVLILSPSSPSSSSSSSSSPVSSDVMPHQQLRTN